MSRRPVLFIGCLLLSATGERGWALSPGAAQATPKPQWIWSNADPQGDDKAWLRKGFRVDGEVETATLYGACDNAMEVFLNGELVATSGEWTKPIRVTVTGAVKQGRNTLAAVCQNAGGPAGLWLDLVLEQGGRRQMIVTDATWQAASAERDGWTDTAVSSEGWRDAHSLGALGVEPWGPLSGKFVDGTPERALAGDAVEVPEGFRVELLYSVPKARQGSWVSMTIDDAGRIVASDQYGGLYRFTPPPLGSTERGSVEKLAVKLGGAHGLLFAFGSLYGVVADGDEYEHGLWRARDTTGDGELDTVELLKAMRGGGEHGPHAVLVGPDGESLYVIGGNHTELPDGISRYRVPPVWGEDQLLPRRSDPRGHAVGIMAPGGWVCRTDPDGREWELVAAGMRNSYDMAFDEEGELFTFDSDMEWDVGLPWYRPTRVLHLVSGADFGWRNGSGKWPAYYPDSLPGVVDIGLGSPTGVTFGKGTSFPARYRRALYVLDWAYGTIFAVHLEPDGASFKASYEPFAVGKPLPVTDVAIGPDGAMYFTTGGRRMQSGLYRVTWVGEGGDEDALASDPAAAELRATRRALERFHGVIDPEAVAAAWPYLDSEDRFVRHAARVAIEHQPLEQWVERVFEERESRKHLEALLALVRVGPPELRERVLDRIVQLRPTSVQEQMDLVRLLGLCFIRMGPPELGDWRVELPTETALMRMRVHLKDGLPSGDPDLDRELVRLLVYLRDPGIASRSMDFLRAAETQEEQIYYAFVLRTLHTSCWWPEDRKDYFRWLNEITPGFTGGASLDQYMGAIRADAIETLSESERTALAGLYDPKPKAEAAPLPAAAPKVVREWAMSDLVPYLAETRKGRDFARGKAAYERTTCATCHRIAGEGGSTGPDLTGAGSRFNERDLLETILEPSTVISDQYEDMQLLMKDGELVVGRIENEVDGVISLRTLPPEEALIEIDASEIDVRKPSTTSRMPEGLVNTLQGEEILDLIAYVLAGGAPESERFAK